MSQSDLSGKTALITGSTSGIGAGLALGLADAGISIALCGFGPPDDIAALKAEIAAKGVDCDHFDADLRAGEAASTLVKDAQTRFGKVDILINNAGIQHVAPVDNFPADRWEAIIAINLSASFYTAQAALPAMKQHGYGRIINIASAHGLVASPYKSAYVAAKHGVVGLTKTIALEVAEEPDVTANAICPGYVRTPLVENQIKDQAAAHGLSEDAVVRDIILAAQPNKRFVDVSELAALARLLCTSEGRSFNGSALSMDGGWTAR